MLSHSKVINHISFTFRLSLNKKWENVHIAKPDLKVVLLLLCTRAECRLPDMEKGWLQFSFQVDKVTSSSHFIYLFICTFSSSFSKSSYSLLQDKKNCNDKYGCYVSSYSQGCVLLPVRSICSQSCRNLINKARSLISIFQKLFLITSSPQGLCCLAVEQPSKCI